MGVGASLEEIEMLYRMRLPDFLRVAAMICGDGELARDAVHDAFAGAVRARKSYRGEGTVEAWLWRAVVNSARKHRRYPETVSLSAVPESLEPSSNGDHRDDPDAAFRLAVSLLPERQRVVLFLRYYADLDYRSIGEALDIRPGTVAATLNAGHAALRRTLQEARS
jgi:RNA polymerase sigma factor (sigma-70 family)